MHSSHGDGNAPDRRRYRRGEGKIARLTVGTEDAVSQDAVVLDESLTGIGLLVKDGAIFHLDQEARLTYEERGIVAIVRHIRLREDGQYHLGLEWGPSAVKPASLLLLMSCPC